MENSSICPLPFIHTYVKANGSLVACCEAQESTLDNNESNFKDRWNSKKYETLRKQMISGVRPASCRKCWVNEDLGLQSNRQEMISNLEKGYFGEKVKEFNIDTKTLTLPTSIEVKLSNVCNLKCRMCHPSSSHRLWEDRDIHEMHRGPLKWNPRVQSSEDTMAQLNKLGPDFFANLKVVQFSGGEPLINDQHLNILEELLLHDPSQCQIRYSTNLQQLSHKSINFLEMWKPFKLVNVKVSIDGLNDIYDYIRVGGSFEILMKNFETLINLNRENLQVAIGFTTQAYNVFQLPEFLDFFEKLIPRSQISTHWLHSPEILSVGALPKTLRVKIATKFRQSRTDLKQIAKSLEELPDNPKLWERLKNYSKDLDERLSPENQFTRILERAEHDL